MGWTASYQVVRDRILDDGELAGVAKLVRALTAKPWDGEPFVLAVARATRPDRVIARGSIVLPDAGSRDPTRLCDALDKIQALLPSSLVRATDERDQLGWDPRNGCFQIGGRDRRPLVDESHGGDWQPLFEAVPGPPPPLRESLADAVAAVAAHQQLAEANRRDERMITDAFAAIAASAPVPTPPTRASTGSIPVVEPTTGSRAALEPTTGSMAALPRTTGSMAIVAPPPPPSDEALAMRAFLAACDPDTVARIGFASYPQVHHAEPARDALRDALTKTKDLASLAPAFVAMWSAPTGPSYYIDLQLPETAAATFAAVPAVRDRLIADLDLVESGRGEREVDQRCAERAAGLLGRSGDDTAIRHLVATVRKWRDQPQPHAIRHFVVQPALEGLGASRLASVAPTLLLSLDGATCVSRGDHRAIVGAAGGDLELARPILRRLLAAGIGISAALEAVEATGATAADLADVVEPYVIYPLATTRARARAAMAAIGKGGIAIDPIPPPPESLVLHPDREVRHDALRAIHAKKDRSLFLSIAIAEAVDAALRTAIGYSTLPFSWWDWKDILPPKMISGRPADRIAWARGPEGQKTLGAQRMLDVIAPIADQPVSKIVGTLPPQRLAIDAATRSMLAQRETAAFGS